MKDYCKVRYPNNNDGNGSNLFYDHCALAHNNERANPENIPHQIYFDFYDMESSVNIRQNLDKICDGILLIGILMNVFGVKLQ